MIESKEDPRKIQNRFPERIYTLDEVRRARRLIERGHRHELRISGSREFIKKTQEALKLIKKAGYYDLLRTYIREILEINGLSQLRECDSAIWANIYTVQNTVDAARLFVQKAWQMKNYIEGKMYYGHKGETFIANKAIEFLKELEKAKVSDEVKKECRERIKIREENVFL